MSQTPITEEKVTAKNLRPGDMVAKWSGEPLRELAHVERENRGTCSVLVFRDGKRSSKFGAATKIRRAVTARDRFEQFQAAEREISRQYVDQEITRPAYVEAITANHTARSIASDLGPCKCMACAEVRGR